MENYLKRKLADFRGSNLPSFSASIFPSAPRAAISAAEFSTDRLLGLAGLEAAIKFRNPSVGRLIAGVHRQLVSWFNLLGLVALGTRVALAGGGNLSAGGIVVHHAPPPASGQLVLFRFFIRHRDYRHIFLLGRFNSALAADHASRSSLGAAHLSKCHQTSADSLGHRLRAGSARRSSRCRCCPLTLKTNPLVGVWWGSLEYNFGR